jgi:16S rRNA (guanine527-N7)-methyltransferase
MSEAIGESIAVAVKAAGFAPLDEVAIARLIAYVSLILRWNAHINLTSIRSEEGIISRHLIESINFNYNLPKGINTLLDFGSGAGLPGIPIAICQPDIQVTLVESQNKKAAFLMEAVRVLGLSASVHSGRAEELKSKFDCVTLRAVDKMAAAVRSAASLVSPRGWLALMTTATALKDLEFAAGPKFQWSDPISLAGSQSRILMLGQRTGS